MSENSSSPSPPPTTLNSNFTNNPFDSNNLAYLNDCELADYLGEEHPEGVSSVLMKSLVTHKTVGEIYHQYVAIFTQSIKDKEYLRLMQRTAYADPAFALQVLGVGKFYE